MRILVNNQLALPIAIIDGITEVVCLKDKLPMKKM